FIVNGIVNDAGKDSPVLRKRDRNGEAGILVGKVCCAIERIDMPTKLSAAFVACAFFGGDGVLGEKFREAGDNRPLAATVSLWHRGKTVVESAPIGQSIT